MAAIKTSGLPDQEGDGSEASSSRNLHAIYWAIGLAGLASLYIIVAIQPVWTSLIPIVIVTAPLAAQRPEARYRACAIALILMIVFVFLGAASVGLFYIPSAIAVAISCSKRRRTNTG